MFYYVLQFVLIEKIVLLYLYDLFIGVEIVVVCSIFDVVGLLIEMMCVFMLLFDELIKEEFVVWIFGDFIDCWVDVILFDIVIGVVIEVIVLFICGEVLCMYCVLNDVLFYGQL